MKNNETKPIRIDPELHASIKAAACKKQISIREVAEAALRALLSKWRSK